MAMLIDHHGLALAETDVEAEWAPDYEAVRLTVKATGYLFLWWPVAPELIEAAERNATRNLIEWQQEPSCVQRQFS